MRSLAAIYDFSIFPYALGDVITWNIRSAMAAYEAGRKSSHVIVFADAKHPRCAWQERPTPEQHELFLSELQPAFFAHPYGKAFSVFHDRDELLSFVEYLKGRGEIDLATWNAYLKVYARRDNINAALENFIDQIAQQQPINDFYHKHGFVPQIQEVQEAKSEVDAFLAAQGDATIVTTQFRLRRLDQSIPSGDFQRDADYLACEQFLERSALLFPQVKFVVLGRLQEKTLKTLSLPNVIAPRALGMNLAHEISLLVRSDFFIGSGSGFAQIASFSKVPHQICEVGKQSCEFYGIPYGADRLPYASNNQKLRYGAETADSLIEALSIGLKNLHRSPRPIAKPLERNDSTSTRFFLGAAQGQQGHEESSRLLLENVHAALYLIDIHRPKDALPHLMQVKRALSRGTADPEKQAPARMEVLFPDVEIQNIRNLTAIYATTPDHPEVREQLKALRQGIGAYLIEADPGTLRSLFQSDFGKVYRILLGSGLQNDTLSSDEAEIASTLALSCQPPPGPHFDLRRLLTHLLFQVPTVENIPFITEQAPSWFADDFLSELRAPSRDLVWVGPPETNGTTGAPEVVSSPQAIEALEQSLPQ